jgi:hypothetical protein
VTTLLERAKGSALDITIDLGTPLDTMILLSSNVQQIRHLTFPANCWMDVLKFSEVISGPLPLLRTIEIWLMDSLSNQPNMLTAPSLPLFSGAINLEEFDFTPYWDEPLNHFVFPNLTTLKLSTPVLNDFDASDLFDFLKASPTLRTVEVEINWNMVPGSIPREMVVLPNVETFSLFVHSEEDMQVYKPAVQISCPRAKYTSLTQILFDNHIVYPLETFPDPVLLKAVIRQYTKSPVEKVTLEISDDQFMTVITYSLIFQSSDATVLRLGFRLGDSSEGEEELVTSREEMSFNIFVQACRTIRDHPLLSHIKCLHIVDRTGCFGADRPLEIAEVVGALQLPGALREVDHPRLRSTDIPCTLPSGVRTL